MSMSRLAIIIALPILLAIAPALFLAQTLGGDDPSDVPSDKTVSPSRLTTAAAGPTKVRANNMDIPGILASLKDSDPQVRIRAANDVRRLGGRAKEAVPSLIEMLRDKDVSLQRAAARAMGQLGPNAKDALTALTEAIKGDRTLREPAISAIAKIGLEAKSAAPALIVLFDDDDEHIRLDAAKALRALGQSEAAEPALLDLFKSTDDFVRLDAAAALPTWVKRIKPAWPNSLNFWIADNHTSDPLQLMPWPAMDARQRSLFLRY
jgi:HEAT repeat protein